MNAEHYDAIVLGAGAAGLSAGIYLARANLKTLIINEGSIGGQMVLTHAVANYPGVREASGREISQVMKNQAKEFGCDIESNVEITKLDLTSKKKMVEIDDDEIFTADVMILATGGKPRKLGAKNEDKFKGLGISYCATCDGDFYTGKDVIVVGGGNSALEEAVSLTKWVKSITVIHQFDNFQAHEYAIEQAEKNSKISFILESKITEYLGEQNVEGVIIQNQKTGEFSELKTDGVFVYIGYIPNTDKLKDVIHLNEREEVLSDENMQTNIKGVFVAGDVREKKYRQITTAVSDGTIAALSAIEYLQS
ncbi:MAG: pyridine nucleotide-disulfide oxidoreductase [Candidatus Cloacimonadota bacterium]|nr:MAG: pyridine nucleotide-disulfide oxidoreductase [Candidatus Cloacimonadota bacterium]